MAPVGKEFDIAIVKSVWVSNTEFKGSFLNSFFSSCTQDNKRKKKNYLKIQITFKNTKLLTTVI